MDTMTSLSSVNKSDGKISSVRSTDDEIIISTSAYQFTHSQLCAVFYPSALLIQCTQLCRSWMTCQQKCQSTCSSHFHLLSKWHTGHLNFLLFITLFWPRKSQKCQKSLDLDFFARPNGWGGTAVRTFGTNYCMWTLFYLDSYAVP